MSCFAWRQVLKTRNSSLDSAREKTIIRLDERLGCPPHPGRLSFNCKVSAVLTVQYIGAYNAARKKYHCSPGVGWDDYSE